MPDTLRLQFDPDTDGTGKLLVEVQAKSFTGASAAWFGSTELILFAKKLAATYPLQPNTPLKLEGGYWGKSGGTIEQLHVGLQFYPIGSVGKIGCRILLSTPINEHERAESQSSLAVELHTTYEQLGAFARSLESLANGNTDEAILETVG